VNNKPIDILREPGSFQKFCVKMDKAFGCRMAFDCNISCPLWFAREVQFLVNEKGMTIGEAHRACMRVDVPDKKAKEIIRDAVLGEINGKRSYPE
jgi:hypothetical protein